MKKKKIENYNSFKNYSLFTEINKSTIALLLISVKNGISPLNLFLLYEKYGDDIFLFFLIMNKLKSKVPTSKQLLDLINDSTVLEKIINNEDIDLSNYDKEIQNKLMQDLSLVKEFISNDKFSINFENEEKHNVEV